MKWATILILIIGLWASAPAQTLEDYTGQTAAQLSAMTDRVTVPNTSYWNTHAYLQLKLLIDRVLQMYSADSTTAYVTWDKLSAAVQDSILSNLAANSVVWSDLVAAVQDSIQHNDRISANGVLWAMLAAAVQDSIQLQDRISTNAITYTKLDTAAAGWIDVRKFGATGDGVTDDTDAIRAATSSGNAVFFPAGTYLCDSVNVEGSQVIVGNNATIKAKSNLTGTNLWTLSGNNISISNLNFTVGSQSNTAHILVVAADTINIDHIKVESGNAYGVIQTDDSTNYVSTTNSIFKGLTENGIVMWGEADGWKITNNAFDSCKSAIQFYSTSTEDTLFNTTIIGNTVKGAYGVPIEVNMKYSMRVIVSTNTVIGGTNGISTSGGVLITGNIINDQTQIGIEISGDNAVVSNNLIERCADGIQSSSICRNVNINNNTIKNSRAVSGADAIILTGLQDSKITGNIITDPYDNGIVVGLVGTDSSYNVAIEGNFVSVDSFYAGAHRAVYIANSRAIHVKNNVFIVKHIDTSLPYAGVLGYYGRCVESTVEGNYFKFDSSGAVAAYDALVSSSDNPRLRVLDNTFENWALAIKTSDYSGTDIVLEGNRYINCTSILSGATGHSEVLNALGKLVVNDSLRVEGPAIIKGDLVYEFPHAVGSADSVSVALTVTQNVYKKIVIPGLTWKEADGITCAADSAKILTAGDYKVYMSNTVSATNSNDVWRIKIYKNNAPMPSSVGRYVFRTTSDGQTDTRNFTWYLPGLSVNDVLSWRITNQTASRNPTFTDVKYIIEKMPER